MIDIAKVKAAFAATSDLCQHTYVRHATEVSPPAYCALSALIKFAGVSDELMGLLSLDGNLIRFGYPVLKAAYGIVQSVAEQIPGVFDGANNEWTGVVDVIAMFEGANVAEAEGRAKVKRTANVISYSWFAEEQSAPSTLVVEHGVTGLFLPAPPLADDDLIVLTNANPAIKNFQMSVLTSPQVKKDYLAKLFDDQSFELILIKPAKAPSAPSAPPIEWDDLPADAPSGFLASVTV